MRESDASAARTLGDFRILREIGRGGMGVVYLAEQVSLRRLVALKVLPAHLTLQAEAVERFHREASTAARLKHPGIVEVHAVGEEEGNHYFAMDFVEGTPLDRILARMREEDFQALQGEHVGAAVSTSAHRKVVAPAPAGGDPSEKRSPSSAWNRTYIETVCRLVAQVADALEHAHRAGVVHRDVKPSNILVREDGAAVLTDFGLAREEGLPSITLTGDFAGTPYYVSPEQAMARRAPVDHRTDVYSLGVTLFEMLTLRRPFEGRTTQEVLGRIVGKQAPSPRKFNPLLPRDLVTIVLTAIDKDPDRRYATAGEFAADLRALLSFKPIAARPASVGTRALKFARRNLPATIAAAAALLSLLGGGIWWWQQPGYLAVTSPTDGATVLVDGVPRGTAPLEVALSPGIHRLRLEKGDDLTTTEDEVLVPRAATRQIERVLASRNGVLQLESDPPGAKVTLVSETSAEIAIPHATPCMFTTRAGPYRARFELPGFVPHEQAIVVNPGGALIPCATRWETGELSLEGIEQGIEVEIHLGDRIEVGSRRTTVTLPLREPLRLPPGTYSLRARFLDHDWRDYVGREAVRLAAGQRSRALLSLPRFRTVLEQELEGDFKPFSGWDVADVDGDGLPEILCVTTLGRVSALSLGRGRVFEARIGEGATYVWSVATTDLDGDGSPEILAGGGSPGQVRGWSIEGPQVLAARIDESLTVISAGDLDGDGKPEIVAASFSSGSGRSSVLAADGSQRILGLFKGEAIPLKLVDLDGRPGLDVLLGATPSGELAAVAGDGTALLREWMRGPVSGTAHADLDQDGLPEIVATSAWGQLAAYKLGKAPPVFAVETGKSLLRLRADDLDGDGRPEIVSGSGEGEVFVHDASGSHLHTLQAGGPVYGLDTADLDGDGRREIFVGTEGGRIKVFGADGATRAEIRAPGPVAQLRMEDLDRDGIPEIVVGTFTGRIAVLSREEDLAFESPARGSVGILLLADLEGDDRPEIVVGTDSGWVEMRGPDGATIFQTDAGSPVVSLAVGSLDGVEGPAILIGTQAERLLAIDSGGTPLFSVPSPGRVLALAFADPRGGGRVEALAGTSAGEIVAVDGRGAIRALGKAGSAVKALAAGDLGGGRGLGIVAGTLNGQVLAVAADGSLLFDRNPGGEVRSLGIADLEGDGSRELVAGSNSGSGAPLPGAGLYAFRFDGSLAFEQRFAPAILALSVADLEGDGRQETVVGTGGAKIIAFNSDGTVRWDRPGGGPVWTVTTADLDRDGLFEVLAGTQRGEILALTADGVVKTRWTRPASIRRLATADLDGDGTPEILSGDVSGVVAAYRFRRDDPRIALRRVFLEALGAAERGDEPEAAPGFERARFRWLRSDAQGLEGVRTRLALCSASPSARRMAAVLERARPATLAEWASVLQALVRTGRTVEAIALFRERIAGRPLDPAVATPLNEAAWLMVRPTNPEPLDPPFALLLAEAAAAANGRKDDYFLDTLAWALAANGRYADAIATEEEAIRKLPQTAVAEYLPQYQEALSRFREAVEKAAGAPSSSPALREGR
ncbi:MAG: FG-GAP-like repeat-containing protein [Planctomycetes bacterium]|nr:FG-GAP-like repeat-containing protein [Planctomycetota bacterium]